MPRRRIPDLDLPLLQDIYHPEWDPQKHLLNHADGLKPGSVPELTQEQREEIEKKVKDVESRLFGNKAPKPLTKEEAAAVEERVDALRDEIARTRTRIATIGAKIDEQAAPKGKKELSFDLDLANKGRLRRAVRKAFKFPGNTVTYSMYKEAIKVRKELEEREAEDYTSGDWGD